MRNRRATTGAILGLYNPSIVKKIYYMGRSDIDSYPLGVNYPHIIMLTVGSQGMYEWLVTDEDFDLLHLCPEIVLRKYVAVTSIDSGEFVPTDQEKAAGWQSHALIAYSPRIQHVEEVPREGWDEWYIFNSPVDLGTSHLHENIFEHPLGLKELGVFVNFGWGFALDKPDKTLVNLFWQQMEWVKPESYVADSETLTFVSMNKALFASVHLAVSRFACLD